MKIYFQNQSLGFTHVLVLNFLEFSGLFHCLVIKVLNIFVNIILTLTDIHYTSLSLKCQPLFLILLSLLWLLIILISGHHSQRQRLVYNFYFIKSRANWAFI